MASERAILEIAADVNKALEGFKKLEQRFVATTDRMDLEAAQVDFDPASASAKRLRSEVDKTGKALQQQGQKMKGFLGEMAKHSQVGTKAQKDLALEVRRVDKEIKKASNSMKKFAASAKAGTAAVRKGFAGLSAQVKTLAMTMGALSIPFLAFGTIRKMADFSIKMAEVKAVSGATADEFERLSETAVELGEATIFSSTQVAAGMALMGRAGFETNEILNAMPGLLDLAAAGGLDLAAATDIAANTLRSFNLEAAEMGRVADVLATTAANSNTNILQLGEGMKFISATAAALGVPLEQVSAALGTLSNKGLQASLAGTSLRATLAALASPTNKVEGALNGMGIELADMQALLEDGDLIGILSALAEAGIEAGDAFDLAGRRGGPGLLALTSSIVDLKVLNIELENATGKAGEMARIMEDTLSGALKKVSSAIEGLVIKTGEGGLSDSLQTILELLASTIRKFDDFFNIIVSIGGSIGGVIQLPFLLLAETIQLVTIGFEKLFNAMEEIPGIGTAFKGVASAMRLARKEVEEAVDVYEEWTLQNLKAISRVGDAWVGLTGGVQKSSKEQIAAIDASTESLREMATEFRSMADLSTDQAAEIIVAAAEIERAIAKLPVAQRESKQGIIKELREIQDEFRETGRVIAEMSEDEILALQALDDATNKYIKTVRGSKAELMLQADAIAEGTAQLRTQGEITEETTKKIGKAVADLLADFKEFGFEAPAALKALGVEFPHLEEAAKKAAKGIKEVGDSAEESAAKMRKLAEESEVAQAALEALRAAETGRTEAEDSTKALSDEIAGLEEQIVLTVDQANRLTEAKAALAEQEADLSEQTSEVTERQVEYQNAVDSGIDSQKDFSKVLVETEGGLKHVETAAAGAGDSIFGLEDAAGRVADSLKSIGDGTSFEAIAEGAEKAGTALEKMADETESMKALAAEAEAAGERITIAFTAASLAVGSLVTQTKAARHACASLKECMREVT